MKKCLVYNCASAEFCQIRSAVRNFLQPLGFTLEQQGLLILAVDEACANILRYAYGGEDQGPLSLILEATPRLLRITLRDFGTPCDPECIRSRALEDIRPGGLGVFLIQQAFDKVHYRPLRKGTRLTLTKKLPQGHTRAPEGSEVE